MEMMNSESRADGENFEKYEQLIPECILKLQSIYTTLYSVVVIRHKEWQIFKPQGKSFLKNTWHTDFLSTVPVPAGLLQFALLSRLEMKNDRPCKCPASNHSF